MAIKIDMKTLPSNVINFMNEMESFSAEVFLVGGAVRDIVMKEHFGYEATPKDYDFATNFPPSLVIELFEAKGHTVLPTGIDYGTVTVMYNGDAFEVTTYRLDVEYIDGRRPDVVEYAKTIEEDLDRRDFTMNAMALGLNGILLDPHDGVGDLTLGVIDFVGNTEDRLHEDALRILRLARFAARFGLTVNPEIPRISVSHLSAERIREELNKTIMTDNPTYGIELMRELGILKQILPELMDCYGLDQESKYHDKTVYYHILDVVSKTEADLGLRLAALFHDLGKPTTKTIGEDGYGHFYMHEKVSEVITRKIMERLKYSNDMTDEVTKLVSFHMDRGASTRGSTLRRFIRKFNANHLIEKLFKLRVADRMSHSMPYCLKFDSIYKVKFALEEELSKEPAVDVSALNINGHDLMSLGFEGKKIGECLNKLMEVVLEYPEENIKSILIERAKSIKNSM